MTMCSTLRRPCAALELLLAAVVLVTVFAEGLAHGPDHSGRLSIASADLQQPDRAGAARSRNSVPEIDEATRDRAVLHNMEEKLLHWPVLRDDAPRRDESDSSALDGAVVREGRRLQRLRPTPAPIPTPPVPDSPSLRTSPPTLEPSRPPNIEQTLPPTSGRAPQPTLSSSEAINTVAPTRRSSRTRAPASVTPPPTVAPEGAFASPTQQPTEEAILVPSQAPALATAAPTAVSSSSSPTFSPTTVELTRAPVDPARTPGPAAATPGPTAIITTTDNRTGTVAAGAMSLVAVVGIVFLSAGSFMKASQGGSGSTGAPKKLHGTSETGGALAPAGERANSGVPPPNSTKRRPAATLSLVLVAQLQFLAVLSLVEYATTEEGSLLADFVIGLRWVNLWWPMDIPGDTGSGGCVFSAGVGEIGASVFVGNTVLVVGILLGTFLLHVAVVSGVEAYWLAKKRATANLAADSGRLGPPTARGRPARFASEKVLRRTAPGNPSYRTPTNVGSAADLTPVREESDHEEPDHFSSTSSSEQNEGGLRPGSSRNNSDMEKGRVGRGLEVSLSDLDALDPVATYRKHFASVWAYFPHVQLVFLFVAFGGAVASQAAALRSAGCPEIVYSAGLALLLYPALMFASIWRIVMVRVRPDVILSFKRYGSEDDENSSNSLNGSNSSASTFSSAWKNGNGVFSGADKGQWETVQYRPDSEEANWFRIGFEPVFSAYTKRGVWFVLISLFERAAVACIGVFIDSSVTQLLLLCVLNILMFAILMLLKPFVNRVVNNLCACVVAINVFSVGLLAVSALAWEGTGNAKATNTAFVVLQIILLCALAIPIYIDAMAVVTGAAHNTVQRTRADKSRHGELEGKSDEKKREQAYIRGFARRQWCSTWCTMLRHNVFACARDTREGLRRPQHPTSARSGPNPAPDPRKISSGTSGQARPPRGTVGTASLPVSAPYPGRFRTAESGSSDRASTSEAASSGRTIIRHGASGRENVPSFADHLKGRDALNEVSERGDSPLGDSPRPEPFTFVPDYRARKEKGVSVSSCDFSSNASGSRSLLERGPSSTPDDSGHRESRGIPVRGDRGTWRVMGMSGLFKRRPPTEITVPRRTEWRDVRRDNLKSSGIGDGAEPADLERPDQDKTEIIENRAGCIPRPSLGTWNLTKQDTSGASSSAFVDKLPTEFSSRGTADEPDEFHVEGQSDGGVESDEKRSRSTSRAPPWVTLTTSTASDVSHRRSSNHGGRLADGGLNADDSSSFELPKDPEESEPINNAVGVNEADNLGSEQQATAYPHLQYTGAWDSAAGSSAVAHEPENLEVGQITGAFTQVQHAGEGWDGREGWDCATGSAHLDTLTSIVDLESPAASNSVDTGSFESESHHGSSLEDTNRSQEDSSTRDELTTTTVVSVNDLHGETGANKKQSETLVADPIQSYSPRSPSTTRASLDEVALPPGDSTSGIGGAGSRDTKAKPKDHGSRSTVSTNGAKEKDEDGSLSARPIPVPTELPSDRYSNYTFEASPPPDGNGTDVKW